jgi:hypothetical protein
VYLLLAKLGLYEASAHVAYGLDGNQAVAFVDAQKPALRDMQEAHLLVGLVDEEVSDEAYVLVVGIKDLAVDQVAWHEEDVGPFARIIHTRDLLLDPYSPEGRTRALMHMLPPVGVLRTRDQSTAER